MRNLWGLITGKDKGSKYPDQQAKFLDRIGDFTIIYPYGMHCDLPNDTMLKQVSDDAAIPVNINRIEGIERGEPVIFHPVKQSYIVFRNNGHIEIVTTANVTINAALVTVNAASTVINGNLTVTGATALSSTVTSNGVDISDTHTHSGVQAGGGNTGVPN